MQIGTKIRINKGRVEALIAKNKEYGLFECDKYRVCRNLFKIDPKDILIEGCKEGNLKI